MAGHRFNGRWKGAFIGEGEWHFHRRLFERYGIVLDVGEFSQICSDVRSGRAPLLETRKGGGIYTVRIRSAKRRVLILAIDGLPRTAWPPQKTR